MVWNVIIGNWNLGVQPGRIIVGTLSAQMRQGLVKKQRSQKVVNPVEIVNVIWAKR